MIKHTPGPWAVGPYGAEYGKLTYWRENNGDWVIVGADGVRLASVDCQDCGSKRTIRESEDPEGFANARLVAAAPELLEALQRCVTNPAFLDWDGNDLDEARAAIAKATGAT